MGSLEGFDCQRSRPQRLTARPVDATRLERAVARSRQEDAIALDAR